MMLPMATMAQYQLPDPGFEDWNGSTFGGVAQPTHWHYSNVNQFGFDFNFSHPNTPGRNGGLCLYVEDQAMKVAGIDGGTSPGYVALGQPWAYVPSLTNISGATAGTIGGIAWTARPDTISLWVKRTGSNWASENYNIVYYMWKGTAYGEKYPSDNGCTPIGRTDEESDIRLALDANSCGTVTYATEVGEALFYEKALINEWKQIKVPIFYMNDIVPEKCNLILSAGNYPAGKSTAGFFAGNGLYVDDVELIYSSKIQALFINKKEWKQFNPNTTAEQVYTLPYGTTEMPEIVGKRGIGTETNCNGKKANFGGRTLSSSEFTIQYGGIDQDVTLITVTAEDGSSSTTYRIRFQTPKNDNALLNNIKVDGTMIPGFSTYITQYHYAVPFGTTNLPVVTADATDPKATVAITQATQLPDSAIIIATAEDRTTTKRYVVHFAEAALSDVTLQDILIDSISLPGFVPTKSAYTVSLPITQTEAPTVTPVSAYAPGLQTITIEKNSLSEGCQIRVEAPAASSPRTYKITYKQEASRNKYLQGIMIDGVALEEFIPTRAAYTILLPQGTTEMPTVTWTAGDNEQTMVWNDKGLNATSSLNVKAGNGATFTYLLTFQVEQSNDATLKMIYLDGKALDGFVPENLQYSLVLDSAVAPIVSVDKGEVHQQIQISQPKGYGTARIMIMAEAGNTQTYTVRFEKEKKEYVIPTAPVDTMPLSSSPYLQAIVIGGDTLASFQKNQYHYEINLPEDVLTTPTIEGIPEGLIRELRTYYASVGAESSIEVVALDGTTKTYTLLMRNATNDITALDGILADGVDYDAATHRYDIVLSNTEANWPEVTYVKQNSFQRVEMRTSTTAYSRKVMITVTASDGTHSATYVITYTRPESTLENVLKSITVGNTHIDCTQTTESEFHISLPYGTREMHVDNLVKNYTAQQVLVAEGGVLHPTTITVLSGNQNQEPKVYTLIPELEIADPAHLNSILVDGNLISGFAPYQYHYIAHVTATPTITWTANQGVTVDELEQDSKHVTLEVSKDGYSHEYTIYFYYENDIIPTDFTNWVATKYNNAQKPLGWMVPADAVGSGSGYTTGNEIRAASGNETRFPDASEANGTVNMQAFFSWNTIAGTVPAIMTIGQLNMTLRGFGSSTSSIEGGITFRNTPDLITLAYKPIQTTRVSNGRFIVSYRVEDEWYEHVEPLSYTNLGTWRDVSIPMQYVGVHDMMNISINNMFSDNMDDYAGTAFDQQHAEMRVRNLRIGFNSHISTLHMNGQEVLPTGTLYSYTTTDPEYIGLPTFAITGEVADQQHDITYGAEVNGVRDMQIRNYAENGEYTDYTARFTRPLSQNSDTNFVRLSGNDIQVSAMSPHARVQIDTTTTGFLVTITPETGSARTFQFVTATDSTIVDPARAITQDTLRMDTTVFELSHNAYLDGLDYDVTRIPVAEFQPNAFFYEVYTMSDTASYTAGDPNQHVYTKHQMNEEGDYWFFYSYAPAGDLATYTLLLNHENASSIATLSAIMINGENISGFRSDSTDYLIVLTPGSDLPSIAPVLSDDNATFNTEVSKTKDGRIETYIYTYQVTAQDGVNSSTYTLTIRIMPIPLTTLDMITLNGDSLPNFNSDIREYDQLYLTFGETLPEIGWTVSEPGEVVTVAWEGSDAILTVTATDVYSLTPYTGTYTLHFIYEPSTNAQLDMIYLNGQAYDKFDPENDNYTIILEHGTTMLPEITWQVADSQQVVTMTQEGWNIQITVTAGDQTNTMTYSIHFEEGPSTNWRLSDLQVRGKTIDGFQDTVTIYYITYPIGSKPDIYLDSTEIAYTTVNTATSVTIEQNSNVITLTCIAEDGNVGTYTIIQTIELSGESRLEMIYALRSFDDGRVDTVELKGFNPNDTEYTYYLDYGTKDNNATIFVLVRKDTLSTVPDQPFIDENGDYMWTCVAQDGTETQYTIHFEEALYNWGDDKDITESHFLFFRMPGSGEYKAVAIHADIQVFLYNAAGQQVWKAMVPKCNPNDIEVVETPWGISISNVDPQVDGVVTSDLRTGQIYYAVFFTSIKGSTSGNKKPIVKGKGILVL